MIGRRSAERLKVRYHALHSTVLHLYANETQLLAKVGTWGALSFSLSLFSLSLFFFSLSLFFFSLSLFFVSLSHSWMRMCGVVWCGVVWCGVVWCVWCGVVWCGVCVVWCGVVWCGVACVVCADGIDQAKQLNNGYTDKKRELDKKVGGCCAVTSRLLCSDVTASN